MVDRLLVERILNDLNSFTTDLRTAKNVTLDEFFRDIRLKRFIERTLHIAIEATIDIAQHIISDERWREAESYRDTFTVLHEHDIITDDLYSRLIKMAAFRNMLVHYYEKIDETVVFGILQNNLDDFDDFTRQITTFLQKERPSMA